MPPNRRRRSRPKPETPRLNPQARARYERGLYNGPIRFVRGFLERAGIEHAIPETLPRERKASARAPEEG